MGSRTGSRTRPGNHGPHLASHGGQSRSQACNCGQAFGCGKAQQAKRSAPSNSLTPAAPRTGPEPGPGLRGTVHLSPNGLGQRPSDDGGGGMQWGRGVDRGGARCTGAMESVPTRPSRGLPFSRVWTIVRPPSTWGGGGRREEWSRDGDGLQGSPHPCHTRRKGGT